ncbi:hypothetical protein J3R83DRAFT_13355 [Lanmaoa asiatica]|nr:hypothetical protein J3R83DRAFT_13355 [Lanmaoa asiatica]
MKFPQSTRKYTPEEKQQLIKNLDIEVEHRVRQLEEWLAVALENFRLHQEGLISRIPKLVRGVTMGEFADKYNGDIQACLRGLQSERMGETEFEIDRDTRKRKWAAAQEEAEASGSGQGQAQGTRRPSESCKERPHRSARMMTATPKKTVGGPANTSRAFVVSRTPGASRTTTTRPPIPKPSPSPHKLNKPPPFVPLRATSPAKQPHLGATTNQRTRPPSSATFNPTMLPPKAPTYPSLRWFTGEDIEEEPLLKGKGKEKQTDNRASKTLRRVNSIVIRRDPSGLVSSSSQPQPQINGTHPQTQSRANSQTQNAAPHSATHSRSNSRTQHLSSDAAPPPSNNAPIPLALVPSGSTSALVSIPMKDGHLLEFDPLTTSPRSLDKLVGITDSAKKQAKEEMARLVKEAVRKWVIE